MERDSFAAELCCPTCHVIASGDSIALMQTRIQSDPSGRLLRVGDQLSIAPGGPINNGYLAVHPVLDDRSIHLLEPWTCIHCSQEQNWAEVIIKDSIIQSISSVCMNKITLDRINYISDELVFYFDKISNVSLCVFHEKAIPEQRSRLRENWLEILYQSL